MGSSEVVNALLEYFVDPCLPSLKASTTPPSLSQYNSVAKQLHAVVLLYNYYHRKQNPQAEYLDFELFCKLAVRLRPALVSYMKFMNQSGSNDGDDLSVTEKAIQEACNISCALDASKDAPSLNKWLIAKVSVLLLDSKKEVCWLVFSSVTDGVWSLLEKGLDLPTGDREGGVAEAEKHLNKKRRTSVRPVTVEEIDDHSGFQQLAFLAVKDATGISGSDLVVLEKHVVYSLSKERTASCFYIMQCTKSINQDNRIPIKETFESLQGPLVKRISGSWSVTEVVEYFHLLPYASIMSAFSLSGEAKAASSSKGSQIIDEIIEKVEAKKADESCEALDGNNLEIPKGKNSAGHLEKVDHSAVGKKTAVDESCEVLDETKSDGNNLIPTSKDNVRLHEKVNHSAVGQESAIADKNYKALDGTKSDGNSLEIPMAISSAGHHEKVDHSAVDQKVTAVDDTPRIMKSEEAGRDNSIRSTETADFNLECLNDTCNEVHREDSNRECEDSTEKESYAIVNFPRTQEGKAYEPVKSTKSCEIDDVSGMEKARVHLEPLEVQMNDDYKLSSLSNSPTRLQQMNFDASMPCSRNGNSKHGNLTMKVYRHKKKRTRESNAQTFESGVTCKAERVDEGMTGKAGGLSTISPDQNGIPMAHIALVQYNNEAMDITDLPTVLASNEKALTKSTFQVLLHKREKLCHQRRKIEDELALCDRSIERILDGGKDNLALKLDTVLGFCDEMCSKNKATVQKEEQQLSKAGASQDLDFICCVNNWMRPSYNVSATDGGFHGKVSVKGGDFVYCCESDVHSSQISEARDSAASQMITKLQRMADHA